MKNISNYWAIRCIAALLIAALPAASAEPTRFIQDRFAIGLWVDPPPTEQHYADLAAAHFTVVIGGHGANTADTVRQQIALCERHQLRAIVAQAGLPANQLPTSPAVWGYMLSDEPSAKDFPSLRQSVDQIRQARPGRLTYIDLFPNYANQKQLGTANYTEYVSHFMSEVNADVLCMNHYPLMTPSADKRDAYCSNLQVMRDEAYKHGIPFWNFFNVMPFGPHSDPTEAQLRWQINTSLAYGAKGVLYFCYWTPKGKEFPKGGAIISAEGRKTRHYDQATRINRGLKAWGPTLMALTNTGVHRVPLKSQSEAILAGTPITGISDGDYLISTFRHSSGRRAVLINNYNITYSMWPTVTFDVPEAQVMEVSQDSGAESPVVDDSPGMPELQISFDAGEGRLFLLPAR